ncbi:MAG TPA: hypothetical protein VMU55_07475 [Solirubrobacteraceae bacterium]|nr:hypothetical protein [Solirubrobacteraceae bacterium]
MGNELPQLTVAGASAWRKWLAANHGDAAGVWLVLAKKGTTEPTSLSYDQALEELSATAGSTGRPPVATRAPTASASPLAGRAAHGRSATWGSSSG